MTDTSDISVTSLPIASLQRGGGLAAWRQIADALAEAIDRGEFPAGGQLPTEAALAARFGVNRHTVRRALGTLAENGLVRATQGAAPSSSRGRSAIRSGCAPGSPRSSRGRAARPGATSLAAAVAAADAETAEALGIATGEPVIEMRTLHRADGAPISAARISLPLPRFAGFDEAYAPPARSPAPSGSSASTTTPASRPASAPAPPRPRRPRASTSRRGAP